MTASSIPRSAVLAACVDMIRACGLTLAELAQELGQPLQAAPIALPPGERLDLTRRPRLQSTLQLADNPDGISVPEIQALWGVGHQTAWTYLDELHRGLHVVRVKAPGVRGSRYFRDPGHASAWVDSHARACAAVIAAAPPPATEEAAPLPVAPCPDAMPAAVETVAVHSADKQAGGDISQVKPAARKKVPTRMGAKTPHKPKPAPHQNVTFSPPKSEVSKLRPADEPIFTEKTIRTIDDRQHPTARWQMRQEAPDDRWPSFSSVPPGVDPVTGKAWERRA